jgi:hypothetical protein
MMSLENIVSNELKKNIGVDNVFQLDEVKEKIKQTNLIKYRR